MKNLEIARILFEIADILDLQAIQWKPQAYRKAAKNIQSQTEDIEQTYKKGGINALKQIPGIGENIAKKIEQYIQTGQIKEYEKLKKTIPPGLEELTHIPGLGPKKARQLHEKLKIKTLQDLKKAIQQNKIKKITGFGTKSQQNITQGIKLLQQSKQTTRLGEMLPIARELLEKIKKLPETQHAQISGSIRRMKETTKDIDILAITTNPEKIMKYFTTLPETKTILAKGPTKATIILTNGIQADIRTLNQKSYGAALQYFTGNKDHNIKLRQIAIKKGYKLNEYGLFENKTNKQICGKTEQEIYQKIGMQYIEPELRENTGEIEAAQQNKLPNLIKYNSIKGDLHMHTIWSDGANPPEEMIQTAIKKGHEYIAITDHSKHQHIANGMNETRLQKYINELQKLKQKYAVQIKILIGSEVDILANGTLDYENKHLKKLDWITASIHTRFKETKEQMTKRMLTAMDNPYVKAISHPTGRLINEREPYELNIEKIFQKAHDNNIAMEINSSPHRLDLKDTHIKTANEYKIKFVINTDSHNTNHLHNMELGIAQARRGWTEEKNVINTQNWKKFQKHLQ